MCQFYQLFIEISLSAKQAYQAMSSSQLATKAPLTLQSTQQALNMLRNLREKRKKENPATIYELVKDIHVMLKEPHPQKGARTQTFSSEDYLAGNRESIEDMLMFIKNKMATVSDSLLNPEAEKQPKISEQVFKASLSAKQQEIRGLTEAMKSSESQSKTMQIKLLNNMKRLTHQVQQKDVQLTELRKLLSQKEAEVQELTKLNEKQHRKIRKMEEDLYDLQLQLQERNEELEAEKQCADFLEKKVGKFLCNESHVAHQEDQNESQILESQQRLILAQTDQKSDMATQTDCESPNPSPPSSEELNHQPSNELENEDQLSHNSSVLTESKQSKYIESIERLTMELGEAYQRINELMKDESVEQCRNVEMITADNIYLESEKAGKNMVNVGGENHGKGGKTKTRSGYFSKFWK